MLSTDQGICAEIHKNSQKAVFLQKQYGLSEYTTAQNILRVTPNFFPGLKTSKTSPKKFLMCLGYVLCNISTKLQLIVKNTPKMAIFADFLDFVEYSTSVEYSDGHEKNFLNPTTDQDYPKKISCQLDH